MAAKGISQDTLAKNLTIVKGNAKDKSDVKQLILGTDGRIVDAVVTAVGKRDPHGCSCSWLTWNVRWRSRL